MFKPTLIKIAAVLSAVALGLGSFGFALADEGKNTAITPPLFFGLNAVGGTIGVVDPLARSFAFSSDDGRLFRVITDANTVIFNPLLGVMALADLRAGDRALVVGTISGNVILGSGIGIKRGAIAPFLANNDFRFRFRDEIRQDPDRFEFRIRRDSPEFFNNQRFFPNRFLFNNNLDDLRVREEFRFDPNRAELRIRQDRDLDNLLPDLQNRLRFEARADRDNEDRD